MLSLSEATISMISAHWKLVEIPSQAEWSWNVSDRKCAFYDSNQIFKVIFEERRFEMSTTFHSSISIVKLFSLV